jgi:hypothetical protein
MAKHLANRHAGFVIWDVLDEALQRRVEIKSPSLMQPECRRRRQQLRDASDTKGVRPGKGNLLFDVREAYGFGRDDSPIHTNRDREARQVQSLVKLCGKRFRPHHGVLAAGPDVWK